ncbi:MAG: fibronectin type III domain-containing protein [Candidatus Eisenbacteria bacterium]|nr:fibronectin type III domain-containing protein [Candidatus Eisenbacteria bacterium]
MRPPRKWIAMLAVLPLFLLACDDGGDDNPSGTGDVIAPSAVSTLVASDATENSIKLTWTAVGDDTTSGTANSYDIRYAEATITAGNWSNATAASGEPNPAAAGVQQTFTVTGLRGGTEYFFAMKTADEEPNWSDLSNIAVDTTLPSSLMLVASSGGEYAIIDPATGRDSVIVEPSGAYHENGTLWTFGYGCRRVYFRAKVDQSGEQAIWGCDAFDGLNVEKLTDHARLNVAALDGSPAEERIVFEAAGVGSYYPGRNIFVVDEDGTGLTQLTYEDEALEEPDGTDVTIVWCYQPVWSPDGTKIAFFARTLTTSKALHYDWVVMDADGSDKEVVNVFDGFSDVRRGGWSHDGEFLFVNQLDGADRKIRAIHVDSRTVTDITSVLGTSPQPLNWIAPSPMHDEIAFDRFMPSATSLYRASYTAAGTGLSVSTPVEVASSSQYGVLSYDQPDWAPFYPED